MSAQRQYEMLFKLGAQLGTNFNGTFSSAQKILTQTQKKIQELNKAQSSIAAYQKQQSGIDKSNEKLEMYRKQLEKTNSALATVQKEIEANGKASGELATKEADLANKQLQLQNRIRDTERAISDKNARLSEMAKRLEDAGMDIGKLSNESNRLTRELTNLCEQEEQAAEEAANLGESSSESFEAMGAALAAAGIVSGLKKIYDAFVECVNVSAEFGATMSTVEALSGANASEMLELSEAARQYGPELGFYARNAAEAMTYMGMAGWGASDMLSGMNGVMSLASASGEDLALVSDIVTDNLTAFKLTAKDTAHFADVLAMAATKTNTSVGIMGETFSNSAAIAGALGYSIEDVSTAVGLMANAGVKGSVAGTALKNMFNGLLEGATLTGEAIGDVEFTSVKADGTMKNFSETIDELRVHFEQMTEAERVNNAIKIAGKYGYNGLLAILNTTQEEYDALYSSISNASGAAQRMSEIQLDNLKGDVTLLNSATEGLKITVGSLYNDELRRLAQVGTEIVSGINEFCEKHPAATKAIMTIAAGIGTVVAGYTAYAAIKKVSNTLAAAGIGIKASENGLLMLLNVQLGKNAIAQMAAAGAQMKLNAAMLANPAGIVTASVIALTAALVAGAEATKAERLETLELTTASQEQIEKADRLNREYNWLCYKYSETDERLLALKYNLDEANSVIEEQSFSVSTLYANIDELHDSTESMLGEFNKGTNEIAEQREQAQILAAKLKEVANSSENAANKQGLIEPIIKRLNELYPSLELNIDNVTEKLDGLSSAINRAAGADSLQAKYKAANDNLASLRAQEEKLAVAADQSYVAYTKAYYREKSFLENIQDYSFVGNIVGKSNYTEDLNKASEQRSKAYNDLQAIRAAIAEAEAAIAEYGGVVSGTSEEIVSAYDAVSIATANVEAEVQNLVAAYNDVYSAAYESVSGQYALWDNAAAIVPTSIGSINSAINSQITYWDKYNDNLSALSERAKEIEGLSDVISGFADGGAESVNVIAGMAKASDDELKKMVENYSKLKQEQTKTSEALADMKTGFTEQMDEVTQTMADTVNKMNLGDEAKQAAIATIDAYANAITARKTLAVEAAEAVAAATNAALSGANAYEMEPVFKRTYTGETDYSRYGHAYASGTDYAERGVALVGEEGPELVFMNGGEKVVNAEITRDVLSRGQSNQITISPQFVINNNGGEIDDRQLSSISERLVAMVLDALDSAGVDRRRSVYA